MTDRNVSYRLLISRKYNKELGRDRPSLESVLGLTVLCGAMSLLPAAFIVTVAPIVRAMRASGSLLTYPINLVFAFVILVFTFTIVAGIIADQYPCRIGVPNCD